MSSSSNSPPSSPATGNNSDVLIREACDADLATFVDFQQRMALETENRLLRTDVITRGIHRGHRARRFGAQYFVAEVAAPAAAATAVATASSSSTASGGGAVAAMMMVTSEWCAERNATVLWIQSVYVHPDHRRRGLFRALFASVVRRADSDPGVCSVRLDVDCTNERARATYAALGMTLEGVRLLRWTKTGMEPEDACAAGAIADLAELTTTSAVPDAVAAEAAAIRIRRGTAADVDALVPMVMASAVAYSGAAAGSLDAATVRAGLMHAAAVPGSAAASLASAGSAAPGELYVAETGAADAAVVVGCCVLTFEWSDWRDGSVEYIQSVSVAPTNSNINSNNINSNNINSNNTNSNINSNNTNSNINGGLRRPAVFRALVGHFHQRALADADVCGLRFLFHEACEAAQPAANRIDAAAGQAAGMFLERYYLMRYDKKNAAPTPAPAPAAHDPMTLPADLPVPVDDGACAHLPGLRIPPGLAMRATTVTATTGAAPQPQLVDLRAASASPDARVVVYVYPRTGVPGRDAPTGWDAIPGARGCTPQSCGFRDHHAELLRTGGCSAVFGLSTQPTPYQQEAATRLHLPFPILSDEGMAFSEALRLPMFRVDGMTLNARLALVLRGGAVEHVMYPVFPPNESAQAMLNWLAAHPILSPTC